jgi:hypothetical protein
MSLKQVLKFNKERKHFAVWLTKATAVCALNGFSPTLKLGFKDLLPANIMTSLDPKKPNELQYIMSKNVNVEHMIALAEQLEKLMKHKLRELQDPQYLESKIALLKTN